MARTPARGTRAAAPAIPGAGPQTRLHIVTGKGGTGKTTAAAALALAVASSGRRVLLVEVEGRQSLAQLFDVPALPYAEQHLAAAPGGGEIVGLAIDPELALIEYLDMFYNLKRSARALRRMGAIDFVTTLAPGLRDVLLTGKVKEAAARADDAGRPAYDAVVLDAPPTGRIRQFLEATREVANLAKVGPINRQSTGVSELLHGPRTAIHLVTLLEEMPVQETLDAAADLTAAGFTLGAVIINRFRPTLVAAGQVGHARGRATVDTAALAAGLSAAGVNAALAPALGEQLAAWDERQVVQDRNVARLRAIGAPLIELPALSPPVDLGELAELTVRFSRPGGPE